MSSTFDKKSLNIYRTILFIKKKYSSYRIFFIDNNIYSVMLVFCPYSINVKTVASIRLKTVASIRLKTVASIRLKTVASIRLKTVASIRLKTVASIRLKTVASIRLKTVASIRLKTVASIRPTLFFDNLHNHNKCLWTIKDE